MPIDQTETIVLMSVTLLTKNLSASTLRQPTTVLVHSLPAHMLRAGTAISGVRLCVSVSMCVCHEKSPKLLVANLCNLMGICLMVSDKSD